MKQQTVARGELAKWGART